MIVAERARQLAEARARGDFDRSGGAASGV